MDTKEAQYVCTCHGLPAWLETDYKHPHWVCEIDDVVCEVIVGVA